MSMSSSNVTESSLLISLADLEKVEHERVREERSRASHAQAVRAQREREAEANKRAREAAEQEARAAAEAREAEARALAQARLEAKQRADIEVARIQAEAQVRLEMENAARSHELAVLRVRRETGRRRREIVLASLLAVMALGGVIGARESSAQARKLEHAAEELREGQRALVRERDDAKQSDLATLDGRVVKLRERAGASGAKAESETVDKARGALDERAIDHGRLRAFADAVDALQTRVERFEKLGALGRRHQELSAWANSVRRAGALTSVKAAGAKANADGSAESLVAYERALDELAETLAKPVGAIGRSSSHETTTTTTPGTCRVGDPSCGLDGRPLF